MDPTLACGIAFLVGMVWGGALAFGSVWLGARGARRRNK